MGSSHQIYSATASLALLFSVGCVDVEQAPTALNDIARYFWTDYQQGEDETILMATQNLHATTRAQDLREPIKGGLEPLTAADVAVVGLDRDPAIARGMYLVNVIPCSLDQIERISYALNQDELYKDVYKSYARTYTSDFDAYVARQAKLLTWNVDITATILGSDYNETIVGGLRRIEADADVPGSPQGPLLLARTYLPEAAVFPDSDKQFTQDYQVEVYYERAPGEVIHFYGMWRHMILGTALDLDTGDDRVVDTILDGLADWDEKTGELCQQGQPS